MVVNNDSIVNKILRLLRLLVFVGEEFRQTRKM